jgi:hypothetical protein
MGEPVLEKRMKLVILAHWIIVAVLAVGLPIAAALPKVSGMKTSEGGAWLDWPLAMGLVIGGAVLVGIGVISGRKLAGIVTPTVLVILLIQPALIWGYSRSDSGRSELKGFAFGIREKFPGNAAFSYRPGRRPPEDLAIYMNRTVQVVSDLSKVPPPTGGQLLFVFEEKKGKAPVVAEDWKAVAEIAKGEGTWRVYHR